MRHCGIDVHARVSELCELSASGRVIRRERMATTQAGFRRRFEGKLGRRLLQVQRIGPSILAAVGQIEGLLIKPTTSALDRVLDQVQ